MSGIRNVDARPDQLKLLKLERRQLKPLAQALLDKTTQKSAKVAALASAAIAIAVLQGAPLEYASKLGLRSEAVAPAVAAVAQACERCDALKGLVERDADMAQLAKPLEELFAIVQTEHERLEGFARVAAARLIAPGASPQAGGTGDKEPPTVWLTQLMTRAFSSLA